MRRRIVSLGTATLPLLALATLAAPANASVGGPDAAGYAWFDQQSGATFNYVDIQATGTLVVSDDDDIVDVLLGNSFSFYGTPVDTLSASTNGFLSDQTANSDFGNTCPVPGVVDGGGFRIMPLHDDLITDVFYEYFDEGEAALLGFPDQPAGISVFQWVGEHFSDGEPVDFEVVLFHGSGSILFQYQDEGDAGGTSSVGLQNEDGTIGVAHSCNAFGTIIAGTTAIRFAPTPQDFHINEIRIDDNGNTDPNEYFEIAGPPGASLDRLAYVVLGDPSTGTIEEVTFLGGQVMPSSGFMVVGEATMTLATPDLSTSLTFENTDTVTHMLVRDFSGLLNGDVDADDDGAADNILWSSVDDAVALINNSSAEFPYAAGDTCMAGVDCNDVNTGNGPFHVFRCDDGVGSWNLGVLDPTALPVRDTPTGPNPCVCGDTIVIIGEDCDDGAETATCDDDCTVVQCGDANLNESAGEDCDDGGESVSCDADCTPAICGDGTVNVTAGEACDDSGESADCDIDCTPAACGDGTVNATAGEECDAAGESAECDADCTAVACGDGTVNVTAGEQCDDAGRSAACNDDCTNASCGDGIVNMTAGEACDDSGESATCNIDCSASACGDGVLNVTAGEECDAGGESAACDDDCTNASCGDGALNVTAGEQCDDGNTDDGDGCSATCETEEGTSSSGGSEGSTGGSEGSSGGGTAADSSGGGTAADTSGSASDSASGGSTDASASASASDSDTDGADSGDSSGSGGASSDSGCSCSTDGDDSGAAWMTLGLLGLVATRRRRR